MAKKSPSNKSEDKITRISASDHKSTPKKQTAKQPRKISKLLSKKPKTKKVDSSAEELDSKQSKGLLGRILGYFKGSWYELRQVRWPDRRTTWVMTGALLLYTGFFVLLILLLDAVFKYLFQIMLG